MAKKINIFLFSSLIIFASVFFIPLIFSLTYIFIKRIKVKNYKAELAVVFGAKVKPAGPSYTLLNRTKHAANLYKNKLVDYIMVSGNGNENEPAEMKKILLNCGVEEKAVILHNQGYNSRKTIRRALALCLQNNWKNTIMVSSKYHLARIHLLSKKEKLKIQISAPDTIYFKKLIYFYFREAIAILYYLLF